MRILIVGAGATGGYFGARLAAAGRDVTFLVRPRRAEQLRAHGLQVESPHGDLTIAPKLRLPTDPAEPFDAVILAVKAYTLDAALDDLAPAIGPDTLIMPLLNGMAHLDRMIARFGDAHVIGGVCRIAATLDDDGRILQLAPFQDLSYGERDGTLSPRIQALDAALQGASFQAQAATDILQQMWEKWILLAAGGALTCLLRGNVGEIEAAGGGAIATRLLAEAASVAQAAGHPPSEKFHAHAEAMLTAKGSAFTTSMYRDLQANRPVESHQILADMHARATQAHRDTPLLHAAAVALQIYTRRQTA